MKHTLYIYAHARESILRTSHALVSRMAGGIIMAVVILFAMPVEMLATPDDADVAQSEAVLSDNEIAARKAAADSLYGLQEYKDAAAAYDALTKNVRSADVYYNLGNSRYRLKQFAEARYAYEMAFMLAPSNSDVRRNLRLAAAEIKTDRAQSQSFLSVWADDLCHAFSIAQWTVFALVAFVLMLAAFLVYYFGGALRLRKAAFYTSAAMLLVVALSLACAAVQSHTMTHPRHAIILSEADVRRSPSANAETLKQIQPGTKVSLSGEDAVDGWRQLALADGTKGWVSADQIGVIGFER